MQGKSRALAARHDAGELETLADEINAERRRRKHSRASRSARPRPRLRPRGRRSAGEALLGDAPGSRSSAPRIALPEMCVEVPFRCFSPLLRGLLARIGLAAALLCGRGDEGADDHPQREGDHVPRCPEHAHRKERRPSPSLGQAASLRCAVPGREPSPISGHRATAYPTCRAIGRAARRLPPLGRACACGLRADDRIAGARSCGGRLPAGSRSSSACPSPSCPSGMVAREEEREIQAGGSEHRTLLLPTARLLDRAGKD